MSRSATPPDIREEELVLAIERSASWASVVLDLAVSDTGGAGWSSGSGGGIDVVTRVVNEVVTVALVFRILVMPPSMTFYQAYRMNISSLPECDLNIIPACFVHHAFLASLPELRFPSSPRTAF